MLLALWLLVGDAHADIVVLPRCGNEGGPCTTRNGGTGLCTRADTASPLRCTTDPNPPECWTEDQRRGVWSKDRMLTCIPEPPPPARPATPSPAEADPTDAAETIPEVPARPKPVVQQPPHDLLAGATSAEASETSSCGCRAAPAVGAPWLGALLLLVAGRRQREAR